MNAQQEKWLGMPGKARKVASFDDFDACAEALRGWSIEAVQLDRGPFRAEIVQSASGPVPTTEARFSRRLHQRGDPPPGMRTVVVPAGARQSIRWRDHRVTGDQIMLFPRGTGLDAISEVGFHVYTISFAEEHMTAISSALADRDYEGLCVGRDLIQCDPETMGKLRAAALLAGGGEPDRLLELVVEALSPSPFAPDSGAPASLTRQLAVRRSLDLISASEHQLLSVVDLCRAARVSRRTLEYAFREQLGVAPKDYMLARRMARVRAELSRGDALSVTEVANRWGFPHLSQFARLYRQRYGEMPSSTARRTNRRARR